MEITFLVLITISMLMLAKRKSVLVWSTEGVVSGRRSETQRSVG